MGGRVDFELGSIVVSDSLQPARNPALVSIEDWSKCRRLNLSIWNFSKNYLPNDGNTEVSF